MDKELEEFEKFNERLCDISLSLSLTIKSFVEGLENDFEVIAFYELLRIYGERNLTEFKNNVIHSESNLKRISLIQNLVRNGVSEVKDAYKRK